MRYSCPCGYYGDPIKPGTCSNATVTKYQKCISGSLLGCIEFNIEVPRVEYEKLSDQRFGEPSSEIQRRMEAARERQHQRFASLKSSDNGSAAFCNSDMRPAEVRVVCALDDAGRTLMRSTMAQLNLSARAYYRVLKLTLTIADLAEAESICPVHIAEALQYRPRSEIR
jgi:magnesium chelatase family protein